MTVEQEAEQYAEQEAKRKISCYEDYLSENDLKEAWLAGYAVALQECRHDGIPDGADRQLQKVA